MKLAFGVQKILGFMLMIITATFPEVSGLIIGSTHSTACDGTGTNIIFDVDLQNGTIDPGSETWYYETTEIANKLSGAFSPQGNYTGRLQSYSTYGLTLYNVTYADRGRYVFQFIYLSSPSPGVKNANATLAVKVTPSKTCLPSYRQSGNLYICYLDNTTNCGSPRLEPVWNHTSGNSFTLINDGSYTCCANGSILTDCNLGFNTFCKTFSLTVEKQNDYVKWIILAVLLSLLVIIVIIIIVIIIYRKYKKWQRRPTCDACISKKCEGCKESFGIKICKCAKSFGILICKFCKMKNCNKCIESAGIVICKCCFVKKCQDCAESARILMFISDNMKNCDACTESSGILICTFCKKEDCKGCTKSTEMTICKCCDSEKSESKESKERPKITLICNCCKQMKCKACSVSLVKESVGMLICKCCNLKYKENHEDGRSASGNGQQENVKTRKPELPQSNSSMSNVSRQDIEIQLERNVNRDLERPFGSPNRIVHKDEPNIEPVPFDPNVRRALPSHPITSGENDRNQRGLSANFEDVRGLPSDTPRSNKLPPINLQLEPTIQEEDTTVKPRKNKKKKKKNKTGDESRNVDEVA